MAGADPEWVSAAQVRAAYAVLGLDPDLYDDLVRVEFSERGVSVKRLFMTITNQEMPAANQAYAWSDTDITVLPYKE